MKMVSSLARLPLYICLGPAGYSDLVRARAAAAAASPDGAPPPRRARSSASDGQSASPLAPRVSLPVTVTTDSTASDEAQASPERTAMPSSGRSLWPSPAGTPPASPERIAGPGAAALQAQAWALIEELRQLRSMLLPGQVPGDGPAVGEIRSEQDDVAERLGEVRARLTETYRALAAVAMPSLATALQWPGDDSVLAQMAARKNVLQRQIFKLLQPDDPVSESPRSQPVATPPSLRGPGSATPRLSRRDSMSLRKLEGELSDLRQALPQLQRGMETLGASGRHLRDAGTWPASPRPATHGETDLSTPELAEKTGALIDDLRQLRFALGPEPSPAGESGPDSSRSELGRLADWIDQTESQLADHCRDLAARILPASGVSSPWPGEAAVLEQMRERMADLERRIPGARLVSEQDAGVADALIAAREAPPGQASRLLQRKEAEEARVHTTLWRKEQGAAALRRMRQELASLQQNLPLLRQCMEELAAPDRAPASPQPAGFSVSSQSPQQVPLSPSPPMSPVRSAHAVSPVQEAAGFDRRRRDADLRWVEAALPRGGAALHRLRGRTARQHPATAFDLLRAVAKPRPLAGRREQDFEALLHRDLQALAAAGGTGTPDAARAMRTAVEEGVLGRRILPEDRRLLLRMLEQAELNDPHASRRRPAPPVSDTAAYRLNVALLEDYAGEETGAVWGTPVAYLDAQQRRAYEIHVHDGLLFDAHGAPFDTRAADGAFGRPGQAIFVMDEMGRLYASNHHAPGRFHHSSFLAGAPVAAAGEIQVHDGVVRSVSRRCTVYQPTQAQLQQVQHCLQSQGVAPPHDPADLFKLLRIPLSGLAKAAGPAGVQGPDPADLEALQRDYPAQHLADLRTALTLVVDHPHLNYAALLPPGQRQRYSAAQVYEYLLRVEVALRTQPRAGPVSAGSA